MAKTNPHTRTSFYLAVAICLISHASAGIIFGSGQPRQPPTPAPTPRPGPPACRDPRGQWGSCLPIKQCPALQPFVAASDVAYLKASICSRSGGRHLLCCPEAAPPTSLPHTARPTAFKSPPSCGLTFFPPIRAFSGPNVDALGDLPWMAVLGYSSLQPEFQCGGAVISERWILTAAHCILTSGPDTVRLGDLNIAAAFDDDFFNPPQTIEVEKSIKHPDFVVRSTAPNKGLFNDIALIKLKQPINFSEYVKPVCLPESIDETVDDRKAMVAGWGITSYGGVSYASMMYDFLNMSRPGECRRLYDGLQVRIDDSLHLCTNRVDIGGLPPGCALADLNGTEFADLEGPYVGDSGGPLMSFTGLSNGKRRAKVLGIDSFAIDLCHPLQPRVFTKVGTFLDWIGETIASN